MVIAPRTMTIKPAIVMSSKVSYSQGKKRKRSHKNSEEGDIKSGQNAVASESKLDVGTETKRPVKKRWRGKKKKKTKKGDDQTYKPVLIIKKPEDYSANWKLLKEIITKDDKPTTVSKPEIKSKESYKSQSINGKQGKRKVRKTEEPVQEATHEEEELDIWFDNVDPILLKTNNQGGKKVPVKNSAHKKGSKAIESYKPGTLSTSADDETSEKGPTDVVAMDCEMVGVGMAGKDSMLARVSIVNLYGRQIYDKFVRPMENVEDYRTNVSGVRPYNLEEAAAEEFTTVQREVSDLIQGRKLVGHAIHNDLRVLYLSHPRALIRDTQRYRVFRRLFGGKKPSLKKLTEKVLGVQIQMGEHNSVQDAQAAMRLYTTQRKDWEAMIKESDRKRRKSRMKQKGAGKMANKNKKGKKSVSLDEISSEVME